MIENDHNVQSNQYRYVCSTIRHLLKTEHDGRSPEDHPPLVSVSDVGPDEDQINGCAL